MKVTKNLGMLLLGVWLILTGLGTLMGILAIAAGALILVGK
jgi:hypothetical protein